ncbi:hypothetical protein BDN72DRAFT_866387 [Pluteus cervinus]|uniref:Uncharacterized protein n=1 Tax=Pluteus cervinus TaxID=181527 RepID=A0ACD2ZWP8_9AGAR|nr:hypothetical protein BDN72DRAFT_866387 [Pluteus cervinus]
MKQQTYQSSCVWGAEELERKERKWERERNENEEGFRFEFRATLAKPNQNTPEAALPDANHNDAAQQRRHFGLLVIASTWHAIPLAPIRLLTPHPSTGALDHDSPTIHVAVSREIYNYFLLSTIASNDSDDLPPFTTTTITTFDNGAWMTLVPRTAVSDMAFFNNADHHYGDVGQD